MVYSRTLNIVPCVIQLCYSISTMLSLFEVLFIHNLIESSQVQAQ